MPPLLPSPPPSLDPLYVSYRILLAFQPLQLPGQLQLGCSLAKDL